ncbi:MAG: acetylxylan esterase [Opitutales bacterium]|nr:acetylxylan esterase [Opitutales bacterium]
MKLSKQILALLALFCAALLGAKEYVYKVSSSVQGGGGFYYFDRANSWIVDGEGPDISSVSRKLGTIDGSDHIVIATPAEVNSGSINIACDKTFSGASMDVSLSGGAHINFRGWSNTWTFGEFSPVFAADSSSYLAFGGYGGYSFNLRFLNDVTVVNNSQSTRSFYLGTNDELVATNRGLTSAVFDKNLNVSGLKLYFASRSGENIEIKGALNVSEHAKATSQIVINSAVNRTDASITSQRVKFGGLNAPYSSKIALGVLGENHGVIEITGEGGSFGGELNDDLDQLKDGSTLSIVMNGSGEQSFTYASSVMGRTEVNSGSLYVNGANGMGDIAVNGGKFGSIGNGVKAKTLTLASGGRISFDLSQYKCSIELSEAFSIPSGANVLDLICFKRIGGQYEYLLIKDASGNSDFSALNGVQKVYTDEYDISSTATFIADKNTLSVNFVDANPIDRPDEPSVTTFEIVPLFENTTVAAGEAFSFKIRNPPSGSTYKLATNMGRSTVATGALTEDLTFTINQPGQAALTCNGVFESDSDEYKSNLHVFAFMVSPKELFPTSPRPGDFDSYWAARKAEVNAVEPVMALALRRSTDTLDLYTFEVPCDGAELYPDGDYVNDDAICFKGVMATGYLAVPKNSAGQYLPAVVTYYGAGSFGADERDATSYAEMGYIGMSVSPPAISQTDLNSSDAASKAAAAAKQTALQSTRYYRDRNIDSGDPKLVYFNGMFKRVYQSLRAAMAMRNSSGAQLPNWDGKNLAARGFSQGGAQTLAAAYLCPQVNVITPWCPAMCNLAAPAAGIYAGWPAWISNSGQTARIATTIYFDTALMSETNQAAGLIGMGLIDGTCAPAVVSAAVNSMKGSDVTPFYMQRTGHGVTNAYNKSALELIQGVFDKNTQSAKVPYARWAASQGLWGEAALAGRRNPRTGTSNLSAYFFGDKAASPISALQNAGGSDGFSYTRQEIAEGVSATPMWSADMKTWSTEGLSSFDVYVEGGSVKSEVIFEGEAPNPVFYKIDISQE